MRHGAVVLFLLATAVPGCMGQNLSQGALLGIAFGLIGAVIVSFIVLGIVLSYINRRPEERTTTHPHIVLRFLKFFLQYLLVELVSIPFTVAGIISLVNTAWGFDVTPISVAFYVFLSLKYVVVIFVLLIENVGLYDLGPSDQEHAIVLRYQKIGSTLKLPPTWITMVEGAVFMPMLMIEGMLNNGELWIQGNAGNFFDYDVVLLVVIDSILYLKLNLTYALEIFAPRPYSIKDVLFALFNSVVTLTLTYLFITYHLTLFTSIRFDLAARPLVIVMMLLALIHNTLASFTSMLLQGIIFRCRALVGSELRVKMVNLYLRWFSGSIVWIIINVLAYITIFALYVIVYIVAVLMLTAATPDPGVSAMVLVVGILAIVVNTFLLLNLIYGILKRGGSYFGRYFRCSRAALPCFIRIRASWIPEIAFNCSSYATEMNAILAECHATFRLNSDMRL